MTMLLEIHLAVLYHDLLDLVKGFSVDQCGASTWMRIISEGSLVAW